jgi:hypothetical protein
MGHPLSAKVGTNFADKRRLVGIVCLWTKATELLFYTPEIAEVTARETNRYAQHFLGNIPNLKLRTKTHQWMETIRNEIMKLLAFFVLQGLHQELGKAIPVTGRRGL